MDIQQGSAARTGARRWTTKKLLGSGISVLLVASVAVTAAIIYQQDVSMSTAARDSDVRFKDGGGGKSGFATVSVEAGSASATISLTGISGATMRVTGLMQIQNINAMQAYEVTLSRSAAPHAAIESLDITVLDGNSAIGSYDAASDASANAFTLPPDTTYDLRIIVKIAKGTAVGSLGDLALQFSISPV